jgi:hypothetical protein
LALTRLYLRLVATDLTFVAAVIAAAGLHLSNTWGERMVNGLQVYPVTYLMTGGVGAVFLIVVTTIYAGELTLRGRAIKYDQIHDTLPAPAWLSLSRPLRR